VYARQLPSIGTPDAALFPTQKRTAFSASSLCQTVNLIYSRAGIEGATSHSGRRSLITSLASKGVGVRVLAAIAGHSDIRVTQASPFVSTSGMSARMTLESNRYNQIRKSRSDLERAFGEPESSLR